MEKQAITVSYAGTCIKALRAASWGILLVGVIGFIAQLATKAKIEDTIIWANVIDAFILLVGSMFTFGLGQCIATIAEGWTYKKAEMKTTVEFNEVEETH